MTVAELLNNTFTAAAAMSGSGVWKLRPLPLKLLRPVPSDMEIASAQVPKPITELAGEIGVLPSELIPYGTTKAKVMKSSQYLLSLSLSLSLFLSRCMYLSLYFEHTRTHTHTHTHTHTC